MNFKLIALSLFAIISCSYSLSAQEVEENIRMDKPFKADGISNEWNEPLNQYNDATKLAFALANDDQHLYIIIESLDPQTTFSVLRGGITLNINTQGKKKDGVKLLFPLIEQSPIPATAEVKDRPRPGESSEMHDPNAMTKSIKVSGFKNITDGNLPAINPYGITTGMHIHPNKDLIYELSIPLAQLQVNLDFKKPLVYNIKINRPGPSAFRKDGNRSMSEGMPGGKGGRSRMGGNHVGMSGGGMGGNRGAGRQHLPEGAGENTAGMKSSDFWIKYKLAKA
ncbi:hypothetical protein ACEN2P_03695 [Pedobacter psychrotolerans]|uniref:hypothetical protein n=1 Tax=Pedobacter psychrotolerans TaxID=1843235 RepID=UPI003F9A978D